MSNILEVEIIAEPLDFTFWHDCEGCARFTNLTLSITLNPHHGMEIRVISLGTYRKNEHGGQTAQVRVEITGQEAVSWGFLEPMIEHLATHGPITSRYIRDIENS